jgi:hypothetical protein
MSLISRSYLTRSKISSRCVSRVVMLNFSSDFWIALARNLSMPAPMRIRFSLVLLRPVTLNFDDGSDNFPDIVRRSLRSNPSPLVKIFSKYYESSSSTASVYTNSFHSCLWRLDSNNILLYSLIQLDETRPRRNEFLSSPIPQRGAQRSALGQS